MVNGEQACRATELGPNRLPAELSTAFGMNIRNFNMEDPILTMRSNSRRFFSVVIVYPCPANARAQRPGASIASARSVEARWLAGRVALPLRIVLPWRINKAMQ